MKKTGMTLRRKTQAGGGPSRLPALALGVSLGWSLACGGAGGGGATAVDPHALLLRVGKSGDFRYIDGTGAVVLPGPFRAGPRRTDDAVFWVSDKEGVKRIDRTAGSLDITPVPALSALHDLGGGLALADRADDRTTLLDESGTERTPDGFTLPTAVSDLLSRGERPAWPLAACTERSRCGFLDKSGAWVVAPAKHVLPFSGGIGLQESDAGWTYYDAAGTKVAGPFEGAYPFSDDGYAFVEMNRTADFIPALGEPGPQIGETSIIDRTGKVIASLGRTVEVGRDDAFLDTFHDGLARLWSLEAEGYGFVDTAGRWVVAAASLDDNDHAPRPFSEGLAAVWRDGGFVFVDTTGAVAGPGPFPVPKKSQPDGLRFSEGMAPVPVSGGWAYVDASGATRAPGPFTTVGSFEGGFAEVTVDGARAWVTSGGSILGATP